MHLADGEQHHVPLVLGAAEDVGVAAGRVAPFEDGTRFPPYLARTAAAASLPIPDPIDDGGVNVASRRVLLVRHAYSFRHRTSLSLES
jgi:hypothetical protein